MTLDEKAANYIKALDPSMENIAKNGGPNAKAALLMALEFLEQKTAYSLMQEGASEEDCLTLAKRGSMAFTSLRDTRVNGRSLIIRPH